MYLCYINSLASQLISDNKKMSKNTNNEAKWIEAPKKLNLNLPYVKGIPLRPIGDNKIQYQINTDNGPVKVQVQNDKAYLMSNGPTYQDMCNMDILNQPQVLNNLIRRYKEDKIFTFIGPTLVVVNPYRVIPQFFSNQAMTRIRGKIIQGNANTQKPHVYLIAGNAFNSMIDQGKKQAIVISGESGAGKTQSTKYCMQILTSLSNKQAHPIEKKILACNPILQAFGNSKTTRNDNSSRFGKYVQIYFDRNHHILGANINSYLLEKSRVVATAEKQRNYHIFYALIASGTMPLGKIQTYKYLERSKCYQANGIDDKEYFLEIKQAMDNIGFTQNQQSKMWLLLCSILELGNLQFNDKKHQDNQSKPCQFDQPNKKIIQKLSKLLSIQQPDLQKILLFQKKKIINEVTFSAYNKIKCLANTNTLSKAIYNAIFQFIIYKIEKSLKPQGHQNMKNYLSINILDIFGFENFDVNSFQQFCINYTNEKLLKLYNQYVFEREMKILKEDGLDQHISSIKAPTNDALIDTIAGKISLFSIINDNTIPQQFKQSDMISGFENKVPKAGFVTFDQLNKTKFIVLHSQCSVKYNIQGFKQKNQDKVLPEISNIVNSLFQNQNKNQAGKTLLYKFSQQIDDLMNQLTTSNVHFIRCIKPNEKKIAKCVEQNYMLTQVRYLGVFQTIQIRKKTFPSRWVYEEFVQRFQALFPVGKGSDKDKTLKIIGQLTKDPKEYLLGNQRIYMNSELQAKLSKKLHEFMKKKVESGKKIWKSYKKYKFRKSILKNLKVLSNRIKIWRKIAAKYQIQILKKKFLTIQEYAKQKKQQQRREQQRKQQERKEQQKIAQAKKLMQLKKNREEEQKKQKQQKILKRKQMVPKLFDKLHKKYLQALTAPISIIKTLKKKQLPQAQKLPSPPPAQQLTANSQNKDKDKVQNSQKQPMKQPPKMSAMNQQDLNETVFDDEYSSTQQNAYERNVQVKEKQKDFDVHQSFLNQKSILVEDKSDVAFEGTLQVGIFDPNQAKNFKKLKTILADKYKPQYNQKSQDFLSPPSEDGNFKLQDTPNEMMQKIIQFESKQFFKKVLRKRTNFFGMSKDEDDILVVKNRPLSKSLTMINQQDEKQAIKIFKQLLKVSQEAKLESVFKQIQRFIFLCRNASPELLNQVLLQLVKQSNTGNQLSSIRIVQAMAVFLHLYDPDPDFIMASLNFIFKKLADNSYTQRQSQYFRYIFKKMIRKLQKNSQVGYMPIKYQIMALMCKRMISIPIYLSVGSSSHIKVQSYQTLSDIKVRAMQELGIDHKRLFPQLFTFFELTNFQGLSEQRPLKQDILVWDLVSYWQRSAQKYTDQNQAPPIFYLVVKIRSVYQCHQTDQESIELMFGQCFFDLFMGRIRVGLKEVGGLAACVKKLKFSNKEAEDYKQCYPQWAIQKYSQKQLIKQMCDGVLALSQQSVSQTEIKFKFLQICQKAPLSICLTVITQQQVRIHFRHKMIYLSQNNEVIEQIPIKTITKYADEQDKFIFSVRNHGQNRVIYTEHASICCKYMSLLQDLVTKKIKSGDSSTSTSNSSKNILDNL